MTSPLPTLVPLSHPHTWLFSSKTHRQIITSSVNVFYNILVVSPHLEFLQVNNLGSGQGTQLNTLPVITSLIFQLLNHLAQPTVELILFRVQAELE